MKEKILPNWKWHSAEERRWAECWPSKIVNTSRSMWEVAKMLRMAPCWLKVETRKEQSFCTLARRNEHLSLGWSMSPWWMKSFWKGTDRKPSRINSSVRWRNQVSEFTPLLWLPSNPFLGLLSCVNICIFANIPGPKANVVFTIRKQWPLTNKTISGS